MGRSKAKVVNNGATSSNFPVINDADKRAIREMIGNASVTRATLLNKLIDPRRDIDLECGYPKDLTPTQYKLMYDREGVAYRVVSIYPEESWADDPEVYESEDSTDTAFEVAFKELERNLQVWAYLAKADEVSGIGRFGVLLLGLDDGQEFSAPVDGINERGEKVGGSTGRKLLYLRTFDEGVVTVGETETNRNNPRYGKPMFYNIQFETTSDIRTVDGTAPTLSSQDARVHWTRIIHIADNRKTSDVYGIPRMQCVFNRLYDLRKIAGGSGEMFWKGGFPGYSFEMDPNARQLTSDQLTDLKESVAAYADGLQRYLTLQGVTAKSLDVQVADPKSHIDTQLELIAITLGVPKRIFFGSEQAKLASTQDAKAWNKRIARRQKKYLTPYVIRPFIDRMIAIGVLPEPKQYDIDWADLNAMDELESADVLSKQVEAFSKYVAGNVDMLIPPEEFLTMFAGLDAEQVKQIMDAALKRQEDMAVEEEEARAEEQAAEEGAREADTEEAIAIVKAKA